MWAPLASIRVCGLHCVCPEILSCLYCRTPHHKRCSCCIHFGDALRCKTVKPITQGHKLIVEAGREPDLLAPFPFCLTTLSDASNKNKQETLFCYLRNKMQMWIYFLTRWLLSLPSSHLYTLCVSYSSHRCDKIPDQGHLRKEERFNTPFSLRHWVTVFLQSGSGDRRTLVFSSLWVWAPAHGMAAPTFRLGLPSLIKAFWKRLHRLTLRHAPAVIFKATPVNNED